MIIDPSYPIGRYEPQSFSGEQKEAWLSDIEWLPRDLEYSIQDFDESHLNMPYREGGWTVKQVVHHVADSHVNAYTRFKLALTEDEPVIKPYIQDEWARLPDTELVPVNVSITLLYALHRRWHTLLKHISDEAYQQRAVIHPEHGKRMTLWYLLGSYAWHGRHHVAHIRSLRDRMGWH